MTRRLIKSCAVSLVGAVLQFKQGTASKAAFMAEYNEAAGSGILLAPELILMIVPPVLPNSFNDA